MTTDRERREAIAAAVKVGDDPCWYTVQEWAEREEAERTAWTTVREQGVSVHRDSEWNERIAELAQRLAAPFPRGTVHVATIEPPEGVLKSTVRTGLGCETISSCVGTLTIRFANQYEIVHLTEGERVALIEALGGVA